MKQFETLRASSLYCRRCGAAMPIREKLLLIVPGKEIFDCICQKCGDSLGHREVSENPKTLWTPQ